MNPTTVEEAVLVGIARLLGQQPALTWREDGSAYQPGERPVAIGDGADVPGVTINLYDDSPVDRSATVYMVQARIRGTADPLDLAAYGAVRDALARAEHPPMPAPADVTLITLASGGRLGKIGGAWLWSLNFRVLAVRAAAWS